MGRSSHRDFKYLARPAESAVASFSGIFAGELAKSRTSCQYVLASRNMKTTLTRRNRKYLSKSLASSKVAMRETVLFHERILDPTTSSEALKIRQS